jgi:hypothetical protein
MAKLIYNAISSLDRYVADARATSTGAPRTMRCIGSSTSSSGQSALTYTGVGCMVMRYWETAPTGNDDLSAEQEYARSGRQPTRSCTPKAWSSYPALELESSGSSTPKQSSNSKRLRLATSP